jgi:CheY-like chemotaxis protein
MGSDAPTAWEEWKLPRPNARSEGETGLPDDGDAVLPPPPSDAALPAGGAIPADLVDHPRYRILELLGSGGMGTVYKARHRFMDRVVALKVINSNLVNRPALVERFQQEIQAAARLSHPNIVTAHDADRAGETHFLVMEFIDGVNLEQVLTQRGRLPVAEAVEYARQVALGLQHAHERGLVHRDVKPRNLMRAADGRIKILDFGLAHYVSERALGLVRRDDVDRDLADTIYAARLSDRLTAAYAAMGTADYVAPEEVLDARQADIRADVYSLGATLYHLLAGRVPFPDRSLMDKLQAHLDREPAPLTDVCPDVPAPLSAVVGRMLTKTPAGRYQTPAEVVLVLAPFVHETPRRVLIIDDDEALRAALTAALQKQGDVVTGAANGREALEHLHAGPLPSLILLDLQMPVMDGWQFLQAQQQDPALAAVPVIILSAAERARAAAAARGVTEYLQKPIEPQELAAHVAVYLGAGVTGG